MQHLLNFCRGVDVVQHLLCCSIPCCTAQYHVMPSSTALCCSVPCCMYNAVHSVACYRVTVLYSALLYIQCLHSVSCYRNIVLYNTMVYVQCSTFCEVLQGHSIVPYHDVCTMLTYCFLLQGQCCSVPYFMYNAVHSAPCYRDTVLYSTMLYA